MKKVLATIVSALVALAFAGLVSAADMPSTDTHSPNAEPEASMQPKSDAKPVKKAKKKRRKAKKAKKATHEMKEKGTGASTAPSEPPAESPAAK